MNASELMVGDYVKVKTDDDTFIKVQIRTLEFDIMWANIDDDETCDAISYDDIEAIPLTQEILEKNGFYEQSEDYMRYFKSYDENYYFGFESISYCLDTKIAKVIKEGKQSGVQEKVELVCAYVHQLQHALRLCGIEKEIVL